MSTELTSGTKQTTNEASKGLDPRQMQDWEVARAAEAGMIPFRTLGLNLGLKEEELIPMGR